jgi:acetoin utilization protein AcuB
MLAYHLISEDIAPLRTSASGDEALQCMRDHLVRHLPIVNNTQFLGLVSEDDILEHDTSEPIGSYELSVHRPYVNERDHIVEVLRVMGQARLTVIPVLNNKGDYLGLITQEDLLAHFSRATSLAENGSVLILEVNRRDYAPGEISRIIESENGFILLMYLSSEPQAEMLEITLKLHAPSMGRIVASLERYNYKIQASYQESDYDDQLRDHYDALIHYLNM